MKLSSVPLVVALPKYYVKSGPLTWGELAARPWIYTDYYCPFQEKMEQLFAAQGLAVKSKLTANDEQTRLDLVRAGVGASLLLAEECEAAVAAGEIVLYESEPIEMPLYLACSAAREHEPLLAAVWREIIEVWQPG